MSSPEAIINLWWLHEQRMNRGEKTTRAPGISIGKLGDITYTSNISYLFLVKYMRYIYMYPNQYPISLYIYLCLYLHNICVCVCLLVYLAI